MVCSSGVWPASSTSSEFFPCDDVSDPIQQDPQQFGQDEKLMDNALLKHLLSKDQTKLRMEGDFQSTPDVSSTTGFYLFIMILRLSGERFMSFPMHSYLLGYHWTASTRR